MRFNISAEMVDFVVTFTSAEDARAYHASLVEGKGPIAARDIAAGAFLFGGTVEIVPTADDAAPTQRAPHVAPYAPCPAPRTMPRVEIV